MPQTSSQQVSAIFPQISRHIPANCQTLQVAAHPRVTLSSRVGMPKLHWRVCCVGLNQSCTRIVSCCTRCRSRQDRQRVQKSHIWRFFERQLQKAGLLTYGSFFARKRLLQVQTYVAISSLTSVLTFLLINVLTCNLTLVLACTLPDIC